MQNRKYKKKEHKFKKSFEKYIKEIVTISIYQMEVIINYDFLQFK